MVHGKQIKNVRTYYLFLQGFVILNISTITQGPLQIAYNVYKPECVQAGCSSASWDVVHTIQFTIRGNGGSWLKLALGLGDIYIYIHIP